MLLWSLEEESLSSHLLFATTSPLLQSMAVFLDFRSVSLLLYSSFSVLSSSEIFLLHSWRTHEVILEITFSFPWQLVSQPFVQSLLSTFRDWRNLLQPSVYCFFLKESRPSLDPLLQVSSSDTLIQNILTSFLLLSLPSNTFSTYKHSLMYKLGM